MAIYKRTHEKNGGGADELEGKYITTNPEKRISEFEIKRVPDAEQYIGWIVLSYNELGNHFLKYDEKTATFTSDESFGEVKDSGLVESTLFDRNGHYNRESQVTPYSNDRFELRIVSYGDCNEKMVLKTDRYELECVPEVFLIENGIPCTTSSTADLRIYSTPAITEDFTSVSFKTDFEVLERQTKWDEIDGRMSMWFRIRSAEGAEGWVWGEEIRLDRYKYYSALSQKSYEKYVESGYDEKFLDY